MFVSFQVCKPWRLETRWCPGDCLICLHLNLHVGFQKQCFGIHDLLQLANRVLLLRTTSYVWLVAVEWANDIGEVIPQKGPCDGVVGVVKALQYIYIFMQQTWQHQKKLEVLVFNAFEFWGVYNQGGNSGKMLVGWGVQKQDFHSGDFLPVVFRGC